MKIYSDFKSIISRSNITSLESLHSCLASLALDRLADDCAHRDVFRCEGLQDAIALLEKWLVLTPQDIGVVLEFREIIEPWHQVVTLCEDYQNLAESDAGCPCLKLPSCRATVMGGVGEEKPYLQQRQVPQVPEHYGKVMRYLGGELGGRWLDLGRQLPHMAGLCRDLQEDHATSVPHKVMTMLEAHYSNEPKTALETLLESLSACELNRQKKYVSNIARSASQQ